MRHRPPHVVLPFLVLTLSLIACGGDGPTAPAPPEEPGEPTLSLEPCKLPGLDEEARCGIYEVWENRAAEAGRKIPLRVVVLPALGPNPAPDPVVYFAGGPGGGAVDAAPGLSMFLAAPRQRRDLLLVDMRGTGESNPLECPYQATGRTVEDVLESFIPTDGVTPCREALEARADLTQYTTPNVVDDLEEIRVALGYPQVNLMGGSYGTLPVQVYLRRHPEAVRSAVIEGVVPMDSRIPLTFARDAQAAFDGLVEECAGDPDCAAAFPDPAGDLGVVMERLTKDPVRVSVVDPESGEARDLEMTLNVLRQTVRYMLYQPTGSLQLPLYLRRAAEGDLEPLAQTAWTVAGGLLKGLPDGIYLSITCTEGVRFITPEQAAGSADGTFLGDFRLKQQQAACERWVYGELPDGFLDPVRSEVPVLAISGERDPVTPAAYGDAVTEHLPNSLHLVIPDAAHTYFGLLGSNCVDGLVGDFFEAGTTEGLDAEACIQSIERPPFLLELPDDTPIELTDDELRRFTGSYASDEGGFTVEVTFEDGGLRGALPNNIRDLQAVAPLRFRVHGTPPGTYFDFEADGEQIVAVTLIQGGTPTFRLQRKP